MKNENNSIEMKTVVETFIVEETQELIYDDAKLQQWNKHVADLGLTGQTSIVSGDKSPIPFMHLKSHHVEMFKVLCPRQVSVKKYNITPIPVEILDLVALSFRENYFDEIEIWYDDKTPDPICVGLKNSYWSVNSAGSIQKIFDSKAEAQAEMTANGWTEKEPYKAASKELYLLGKWADVKATFAELKERAKTRFVVQRGAELQKEIKEKQRELDDIELRAIELMGA